MFLFFILIPNERISHASSSSSCWPAALARATSAKGSEASKNPFLLGRVVSKPKKDIFGPMTMN